MPRLAAIVRLLLTLALLIGASPSWAADCCCEPASTKAPTSCKMDASPLDPSVVTALCAPPAMGRSVDGCPCWESGAPAPAATQAVLSQMVAQAGMPLVEEARLPRPRAVAEKAGPLAPPPSRPPVDLHGWSYALFPLPPPSRS